MSESEDGSDGRRPTPRKAGGGAGRRRGQWHNSSKRDLPAKGSNRRQVQSKSGKTYEGSPRAITSLPEAVFQKMAWLAKARRVPLATVLRDACIAYVDSMDSQ